MNWRNRVEKAFTGEDTWFPDGKKYYGENKDVKRIINKCRIKYSGDRDMKHCSGNTFNSIKYFNVNGTTYKVIIRYYPDQCHNHGIEFRHKLKSNKALKAVSKMNIYNSFDEVPEKLRYDIDYRRCSDDGSKVVAWECVRAGF